MDRTVPWEFLTLEQQLNKTCNGLANCTITRAGSCEGAEKPIVLLLPYKGAAIITEGLKITSSITPTLYNNHTDPELPFWIPYYLLLCGQTPMSELGPMSAAMKEAAEEQDSIG
jgi:hypothetical protein